MSLQSIARPREQLVTASPSAPVREVARYMQEQAVGSVVIVEDDEPVGIVTDRDLALKVINRNISFGEEIREVMTRDPETVDASMEISDVCRKMKRSKVRRLPVVEDGRVTGIVAADDMFVLLREEFDCLAEVIDYESPAR